MFLPASALRHSQKESIRYAESFLFHRDGRISFLLPEALACARRHQAGGTI